jgi:EpsI family protein
MPIQNYETKITNYPSEILLTRSDILAVTGKDGPVKVRRASWNEAGVRRTAYYWYVIDNQILTERFQAKRETLRQAFEKGRTAAAIVIVVSETTLPSDEAERNTLAYVEEAIPIVNEHLY